MVADYFSNSLKLLAQLPGIRLKLLVQFLGIKWHSAHLKALLFSQIGGGVVGGLGATTYVFVYSCSTTSFTYQIKADDEWWTYQPGLDKS
jgi:hypothetical protein